jgi:deoxyhypusine synthase
VPIFCPAFTDSSAGFGLSKHQAVREKKGAPHVAIDSVRDFRHLTETVIKANEDGGSTGLFMIGGGVPKNFLQDTVVNADMLGHPVNMHKFAIQITVADVRDGGCSSSTLEEANSWGKVDKSQSQMVYDEATKSWPLIVSYAYHQGKWWHRRETNFLKFLNALPRP